jgi:hypothetical protein
MAKHTSRFVAAICVAVTLPVSALKAQKPVRKPATLTLKLTGLSTFSGQLTGTCEFDPAEHRITVDGRGSGATIRAYVDYPSKTSFKVAIEGIGGGKDKTVARVNTVIDNANYVAAAGAGALDDAAGASGRLKAEGFIKAGVSMQAQNLVADLSWKCQ